MSACEVLTYQVVHVGGPANVRSVVIRPLQVTMSRALRLTSGRVGDGPDVLSEQRGGCAPVPDALRPITVRCVLGVPGQTSGELKQATVGDGVLGEVAFLPLPHLPPHAAMAAASVPAGNLGVEHTLSKRYPGGLAWLFGEVEFCCRHGRQTPKNLVIVSEVLRVVGGHVVAGTRLPIHARLDEGVVLAVAGKPPVLDEGHEHRAALPPGAVKLSGNELFGSVIIVGDQISGDRFGR